MRSKVTSPRSPRGPSATPGDPPSAGHTTSASRSWFSRQTVAIFVGGLLLSGLLSWWLGSEDARRRQFELERIGRRLRRATQLSFGSPLEVLLSLAPFFESSDSVTRSEFRHFVSPALERHPGVLCFQWFPLVPGSERKAYEARALAEGVQGFTIKDVSSPEGLVKATERDRYLPLFYCEPPNEPVLGLDLLSDPARAEAPLRALESAGLFATERTFLVEDPRGSPVVFVYHRVLRGGADEPERAIGVVNLGLRVHDLMRQALDDVAAEGVEVIVRDESAPSGRRALFGSSAQPGSWEGNGEFRRDLAFADRTWSLEVRPLPGSPLAGGTRHLIVLAVGALLSFLVALVNGFLATILRLRRRVEAATRLGQYTLGRKLGEGGMGQVYEARHAMLRRPTAIKLLHPERADRISLRRFEQEVQHTSSLTHPNTVSIFDYGCTADGVFYYAMEFLEGQDLSRMVREFGALPEGRVVHLLLQACGSLQEAHLAGLIHRDIKPENLFVCRRGAVDDVIKVLDFGLVLSAEDEESGAASQADSVAGTPAYMAPEAGEGRPGMDARSDLYSLGAVAYFMLTGVRVFEGDNPFAVLMAHQNEVPIPPSERLGRPVDPGLEAVILRCLAKQPADRPASAAEVAQALRDCACFGTWSDGDATAWWQEHAGELRSVAPGKEELDGGTMELDLRGR